MNKLKLIAALVTAWSDVSPKGDNCLLCPYNILGVRTKFNATLCVCLSGNLESLVMTPNVRIDSSDVPDSGLAITWVRDFHLHCA